MAKRGRKPKRRINWDANKGTILSAFSLFLLVLGFISLLSIFAGVGESSPTINSKLRGVLVNAFGLVSVFVPFLLFYAGLATIGTIRSRFLKGRVLAGFLILFVGTLGMFGKIGGTVGSLVQAKTGELISMPGAIFFYFVLVIFSIVLITNTGLHVFVEKFNNLVDFIREKVFRIKIPRVDEELSFDSTGEAQLETAVDVDIVESTEELERIDEPLDDFQVIAPPTGPVQDNGESLKDVDSTDESVASATPGGAEAADRTSVARLPFSNKVWEYPSIDILSEGPNQSANAGNIEEREKIIEDTLKAFGVKAKISDVSVGPAVTQYALDLSIGTKTSKIQNLSTDLALRLRSPSGSVRVVAPIPGTNLVGIEVPNFSPSLVTMRSVLNSDAMKRAKSKLAVPIGHDVSGKTIVQDISAWPHCLVAGATGSGKSVMLTSIITTLLFRCSPSECRFIMVDPKLVELSQFDGIPHLLTPVVTDVEQKAVSAFAWAVAEMERRYKLFANAGVKSLDAYNKLSGFQAEPYIVIVVDELADMMMVAASEVEKYVIRLAQKSRATGIHLILSTQRPSVNILTGTIKANIPTRIAFKVTSQVDSRVIIDQVGAETLIGRGDMLFIPPDDSKPRRIQGAFVSDKEVSDLVEYLKNTGLEPEYKEEVVQQKVSPGKAEGTIENVDDKMVEALEIVIADGKASASYLQRKLGIGYTRAARLIDDMEDAGIIGQARGSKPREVLAASLEEALERLR